MKKIKNILIFVLLIFLLQGCGKVKQYNTYTVYPVGYLLDRIGGDSIISVSVQDSSTVQRATVASDYEDILSDSLYFYHIGKLEPYLDVYDFQDFDYVDIDLSSLNVIYKFQRYRLMSSESSAAFVEEPYYSGPQFDMCDMYEDDLFLWLDPIGMLSMATDIFDNLSRNYAEQSSYFKDNYEALKEDLYALDVAYQNLSTRLKNENKTIKFVSITPSFGCWQKAYGFQVYPICLSRYGALPTDEQLTAIKEMIKKDGVEYIAYEPNLSGDMLSLLTSLEEELGLKRFNLSNLSSLSVSQASNRNDYLSVMYENLNSLEAIATNGSPSSNDTSEDLK